MKALRVRAWMVIGLGLVMSGCLVDGGAVRDHCGTDIEIIDYSGDGQPIIDGSQVALRTGTVTFKATSDICPESQEYRWEIFDLRHSDNDPDPWWEGGFGRHEWARGSDVATFNFTHTGMHLVSAHHPLETDERGWHLSVDVYFVEHGFYPEDGSAVNASVPAFCCPGTATIDIWSHGPLLPGAWVGRVWMREFGTLWEGRVPQDLGRLPFHDLPPEWNGTLHFIIERDSLAPSLGGQPSPVEYEIRAGPYTNWRDQV